MEGQEEGERGGGPAGGGEGGRAREGEVQGDLPKNTETASSGLWQAAGGGGEGRAKGGRPRKDRSSFLRPLDL